MECPIGVARIKDIVLVRDNGFRYGKESNAVMRFEFNPCAFVMRPIGTPSRVVGSSRKAAKKSPE